MTYIQLCSRKLAFGKKYLIINKDDSIYSFKTNLKQNDNFTQLQETSHGIT
jgi:hypothetical protein